MDIWRLLHPTLLLPSSTGTSCKQACIEIDSLAGGSEYSSLNPNITLSLCCSWHGRSLWSRTCCCWMSRPITWIYMLCFGWRCALHHGL